MGHMFRNVLRLSAIAGLLATSAAMSANDGVSIDVTITGLRNEKGLLLICLTANPKAWPDCSKDPDAHKRRIHAANLASVEFTGVSAGHYAVSLVHDENSNGKLDTAIMIPKEGFGFSRNPSVTFGPPKFKSAQFTVGAADISQTVKMKYML